MCLLSCGPLAIQDIKSGWQCRPPFALCKGIESEHQQFCVFTSCDATYNWDAMPSTAVCPYSSVSIQQYAKFSKCYAMSWKAFLSLLLYFLLLYYPDAC